MTTWTDPITQFTDQKRLRQAAPAGFVHPHGLSGRLGVFDHLIQVSQATDVARPGQSFAWFTLSGVRAAGPEIDDLPVMTAKHPVHFPREKQGQMRERCKSAIGEQHIALVHLRMHDHGVTHVVRAQRRGDGAQ